jgi:hypothetical protein
MRKSPLLLAILGALSGCSETFEDKGCKEVPEEQTECEAPSQVKTGDLFLPGKCGELEIVEVLGPGTRGTTPTDVAVLETCCYPVLVEDHDPAGECVVGRPYYENGRALSAPLLAGVPAASEARRAAAWASAGAGEHASIAAFARLALQLLRHAAPTALLTGVHQAAIDEVRHSEVCWGLAERFGAERVQPGAFPFAGPVPTDVSLAELAAASVREGCLAETLGAHVAQIAAELAPEREVRDALAGIAGEEARHAVLSFQIVAWALAAGGAEVKAAVQRALGEPWPELDVAELALRANVPVSQLAAAARAGVREVLEPAIERLLSI